MSNFKNTLKSLLIEALTDLSIKKINLHKPYTIGITGNVGKTTTKDYIYTVLENNNDIDNIRASEKSFNSEIGIPLTILGEENKWNNYLAWSFLIFRNYLKYFFAKYLSFIYTENYPHTLVLEVGADGPLNILHATRMIKPDMVVLTAFAEHPVHLEFFPSREAFIQEKKYLVDAIKEGGTVIYNADDIDMTKMALESNAKYKISYGKSSKYLQLLTSTFLYDENQNLIGSKIIFNLENIQYKIDLKRVLGGSHAYALLASVCVGIVRGISMDEIVESFENTKYPKSRLRIFEGVNDSIVIDDTYNSSPKAAELALDVLKSISTNTKKIVVLGHMAELGVGSDIQHRNIGMLAAESADIIIFSGINNEWYLEGVRQTRFNLDNVYLAKNASEVTEVFSKSINLKKGDIILLKGSQSSRVEKVVVKLLKNEFDIDQICRQEKEWQNR